MKKVILILLTFCLTSNNFFAQHDSKVHFDNSKSFAERKKFKEALIEIDKALEIDSLNRNYLLQKIKIQYYSSKCLDAFETLKKLMQSNNKLDDEIVSYFCDLSDCIQEPEMATEILRKYVDDKKFKAPEMLIRLGQRYYNIKEYDKSVYYYREAIRIEPKDINAIIDLAKILYSFKGNKEAKAELIKGLENNKDNILLLTYLVSYYYNENDIEAALKIEDKIIELEYKPEHLASRAMLYESLENRSKAYDDYNRIIELTECDLEYFIKILQYEFENKMYEKVIENSHKLIACDKKNESIVLDGLYTSLFFCNDIANGNFFLNKKLELNPDNFNPYYIKAIILLKDEQYERALNYLDLALKAKDINKENITSVNLLKLGCYLLKEDYDRFVDCWKIANIKSLNDNLNFIFLENYNAEKVKINLEFNRNEGIINSTIIVPTKVFILLKEKYGLIIN